MKKRNQGIKKLKEVSEVKQAGKREQEEYPVDEVLLPHMRRLDPSTGNTSV
jgi:hypothetical protein